MVKLNNDWDALLAAEFSKEYYLRLRQFLKQEYATHTIYPDMYNIFEALRLTAFADVRVVVVGQDPYIGHGQAHGLAFSVLPGAAVPPSLRNIFKEIARDIGGEPPQNGDLRRWAQQGVLLLNTVLTVRAGASRSHAAQGWEQFTDAILSLLNNREKPAAFLLWGRDAQQKGRIITARHHLVLRAPHPSPLAQGFAGCGHFSQVNAFLDNGIEW